MPRWIDVVESEEMMFDDVKSAKTRFFLGIFLFLPTISTLINLFWRHNPNAADFDPKLWYVHLTGALIAQLFMFWVAIDHNPLKWWKAFFGVTIRVNSDRVGDQTSEDIQKWVEGSIRRPNVRINALTYRFLHKRDATLCKLAWG